MNSNRNGLSLRSNRGIATIMVLGMLALLLVLGVSFAVMMRVERTASGNATQSVYSRHIVLAALAKAMEDVDRNMTNNGLTVYPPYDIAISTNTGHATARLTWGEPLKHVPGFYSNRVSDTSVTWQSLVDQNGTMGRFAYVVVNLSGMLDASCSGGNTNRLIGLDASEIDLTMLPDVDDEPRFLQRRQIHERYETVSEFAELTKGYGIVSNEQPMNFVTYSRYPAGRWSGTNIVTNLVYIGGDVNSLLNNRTQIVDTLFRSMDSMGHSVATDINDANFVFTNLLDYIDTDNIPRNLGSACTESVPMLNEMVHTGRVSLVGADTYTLTRNWLYVEWAYPFVRPSSSSAYYVHVQGSGYMTNATSSNGVAIPAFAICEPATYVSGEVMTHRSVLVRLPQGMSVTGAPNDSISISLNVRAQITMSATMPPTTNDMVDASPFPTNGSPITFSSTIAAPGAGVAGFDTGREVKDPRFNWMVQHWFPSSQGRSLDAINERTRETLSSARTNTSSLRDVDYAMYVSDQGCLASVGELGHLVRSTKQAVLFETVRLFAYTNGGGRGFDRVLDYFTTTNAPPEIERGLVNINSTNIYALRSVFYDCPVYYPGNTNRLGDPEVQDAAEAILSFNTNGSAFFTNKSDIGKMDFRAVLPSRTDLERDAAIAYSYRMFGTRQNLFLVIVSAGPAAKGMGRVEAGEEAVFMSGQVASWLGFQRAVALVWRDPFPDAQGICRQFVKYYRLIED